MARWPRLGNLGAAATLATSSSYVLGLKKLTLGAFEARFDTRELSTGLKDGHPPWFFSPWPPRRMWRGPMSSLGRPLALRVAIRTEVYMVTGCSNGIGLACGEALLTAGATLVMACRPGARRDGAVERLRCAGGGDRSLSRLSRP